MAFRRSLAEVLEVVDFAVEDDLDRAVLVADGLVARGEVDNREAAVHKAEPRVTQETLHVRATMAMASPIAFRMGASTGR